MKEPERRILTPRIMRGLPPLTMSQKSRAADSLVKDGTLWPCRCGMLNMRQWLECMSCRASKP